jgi:5'-3' exonuclease
MTTTYILIDASYFIFYRVHALYSWWKLSHPDEDNINLHENPEFIEKFISTFKSKLLELPKKLNLLPSKKTKLSKTLEFEQTIDENENSPKIQFIIGKDCPRQNIWRLNIYSKYKATRDNYENKESFNPGHFFKMVYSTNLFETTLQNEGYSSTTLFNDCLEADDCLAICSRYIYENTQSNVYIITSDTDYMQLINDRTKLFNLKYKPVNTEKNSLGKPSVDLLFKILTGDKSDNIPSTFKKCGKKTALKYCNNVELLKQDLEKKNAYEQYKLNRRLIDFREIPQELQNNIITQIKNHKLV